MREWVELIFGMIGEKSSDHALGLGNGKCADGIYESPTRLDPTGADPQNLSLSLSKSGNSVGFGGPAGVRISTPGANSGAGGIYQDTVILAGFANHMLTVPNLGRQIPIGASAGTPGRFLESTFMDIAGDDDSFTTHQGCQVESFPTCPRANVPPALTWVGVAGQSHCLRGEILDLKVTAFKSVEMVNVDVWSQFRRSTDLAVDPGIET